MNLKPFATKVVIDIETGKVLHWEGRLVDVDVEPVLLCKKGRKEQEAVAQQQLALAQKEQAERERQRGLSEPIVGELEQETGPGRLSRYAASQLGANLDNIARFYRGARQTAYRSLGQRGFGRAPSGFERVTENALTRGEEQAGTDAMRQALADTLGQRLTALDYRTGRQDSSGQLGQSAYSGASDAAYKRSQMGSGFGDVLGGIAQIAPIIAAPFTGGASLAGSLFNLPTGASKKTGIGRPRGGNIFLSDIGRYGGGG